MKKNKLILGLLLISISVFSQIEYVPQYVPMDVGAMKNALDKKQAHYDHNKQYIKNLIDWIFELKSQTDDLDFRNVLDINYKKLRAFDGKDLSLLDTKIRAIELDIKEEIEKYNAKIREANDPTKYWEAANSDLNKKLFRSAIGNYDKVEQLSPDFTGTYLYRGFAYQNLDNYGASLSDYSKFISLEPNNPAGYLYRGWLYYNNKEYSKSIDDFNNLIRLDPNNKDGYSGRGWAKYYNKDYIGSIQDFNKQIELEPNSAIAYYNRGSAKSQLNDYFGAISDYERAIKFDPSFSMAYNNLAWSKFNQQKFKEALNYANKAIELDSRNYIAYDSRAEIKFNLNDYEGCIQDCDIAIEINPNMDNSYFLKGRASYRLGSKQKACEYWSKAGELGKVEAYEYISKYCNN